MDLGAIAFGGTSHSLKLQHYWTHIIRLFCVISMALVGEILPLPKCEFSVFYSPSRLGYASLNTRANLFFYLRHIILIWLFYIAMKSNNTRMKKILLKYPFCTFSILPSPWSLRSSLDGAWYTLIESAEREIRLSIKRCHEYDTKFNLIRKLQFRKYVDYPIIAMTFRFT